MRRRLTYDDHDYLGTGSSSWSFWGGGEGDKDMAKGKEQSPAVHVLCL